MSSVLKEMFELFQVKQFRTSVYHTQNEGLVERYSHTMKQMLCKIKETDGRNCDQLLPYMLFSIREDP